jgi:hypothetical protein
MIGYALDTGFLEENVTSLEIDKHSVEEVAAGQRVGIKTTYTKQFLKEGILVYKVR